MTCFADTSLLLSLVGTDARSPSAKRWWLKLNGPLVTTALVIFETENRLRSMRLQKLHTKEEARASRSGFQDNPDRDGLATVWTHPPQPRIEFPGAFYHVMARGNRCESISHDDDDRRFFLCGELEHGAVFQRRADFLVRFGERVFQPAS